MEVLGDIVNAQVDVIAHQCNCVTKVGKGLSHSLFKQYPEANIYRIRKTHSIPGNSIIIYVEKPRSKVKYIANMLAQYYPGPSKYENDTPQMRVEWFKACLQQVADFMQGNQLTSLALPYRIGCGLAGGNWTIYEQVIREFSEHNFWLSIYMYTL